MRYALICLAGVLQLYSSEAVGQDIRLRIFSDNGAPLEVTEVPSAGGASAIPGLSAGTRVWYFRPATFSPAQQQQHLQIEIVLPSTISADALVENNPQALPNAYAVERGQKVTDRIYRIPVTLSAANTTHVPLQLSLDGAPLDIHLYAARPPFGWQASACGAHEPIVIVAQPGSNLIDIRGIQYPREIADGGQHVLRVDGSDHPTGLTTADGLWKVRYNPPRVQQSYNLETVFRTRLPYVRQEDNTWVREQASCQRVTFVQSDPVQAALTTLTVPEYPVQYLYPDEDVDVRLHPSVAGAITLAARSYPLVTASGMSVGQFVVRATPGNTSAEGRLQITNHRTGEPIFVADPQDLSRHHYRILAQPRSLPTTQQASVLRDGREARRQIWRNDRFTLQLVGSNLDNQLSVRQVPGILVSNPAPQGRIWRAAVQVDDPGQIGSNLTIILTDGRRDFATPAQFEVVENPAARSLREFFTINDLPWHQASLPAADRRDLGSIRVRLAPLPQPTTFGPQHLMLRVDLRSELSADVFSHEDALIVSDGQAIERQVIEWFAVEPQRTLLRTAGSTVHIRLAHNRERHPGVDPADTAYVFLTSGNTGFLQVDLGGLAGPLILRHSRGVGNTSGFLDPLIGGGPLLEYIFFNKEGRARPFRLHAMLAVLRSPIETKEAQPVATEGGGASIVTEEVTVERTQNIFAILPGASLEVWRTGTLSRVRLGVTAGVGWNFEGGKPIYLVFLHPAGLNIPLFSVGK